MTNKNITGYEEQQICFRDETVQGMRRGQRMYSQEILTGHW